MYFLFECWKVSYFLKFIKHLQVDFIEYSVDYMKCKILYFWTRPSHRIEIKYDYLESKIKLFILYKVFVVLTFINGAIHCLVISNNNNKYIKITRIF